MYPVFPKILRSFSRRVSARKKSTIYALSSGRGKSAVAVIRVSGPSSESTLKHFLRKSKTPEPRRALLKDIIDPNTGCLLDKGLILWFPGPNSYTGEDSFEFQVHGGEAVISSILTALSSQPDLRIAEPGEFTKRAFYNGKIDLTEVEGISDLIAAETEIQRKQALLQTKGSLRKKYDEWNNQLIDMMRDLEAFIDFDETDTIDESALEKVQLRAKNLNFSLQKYLKDGRKGEMRRSGIKTVILGEPNVGKSSLFNELCGYSKSIVSPRAGTTRDMIDATLNIGGYPVVFQDTAGLHQDVSDPIEKEGICRSLSALESADFVLFLVDARQCKEYLIQNKTNNLEDFIHKHILNLSLQDKNRISMDSKKLLEKLCLFVINKCDLVDFKFEENLDKSILNNFIAISCKENMGISMLVDKIKTKITNMCGDPNEEFSAVTQSRHRYHLERCVIFIEKFLKEKDVVLAAEFIRMATKELGELSGKLSTETLLDKIFKEFCIGK